MLMQFKATRLLSILALGVILTGCASKKPAPAPAAPPPPPPPPASLGEIKNDLLGFKAQMNVTTDSVNALAKSTATDIQPNYNRFSSEYAKLSAMVESNRSRVQDLKVRTQNYYDSWTKEAAVTNPDLQRKMMQQRIDAQEIFGNIKTQLELAKLSFDPYMTNLKDIQSYLANDITPARVATASDLVATANTDGKAVAQSVDAIVVQIDKIMVASGEAPKPTATPIPAPAPAPAK